MGPWHRKAINTHLASSWNGNNLAKNVNGSAKLWNGAIFANLGPNSPRIFEKPDCSLTEETKYEDFFALSWKMSYHTERRKFWWILWFSFGKKDDPTLEMKMQILSIGSLDFRFVKQQPVFFLFWKVLSFFTYLVRVMIKFKPSVVSGLLLSLGKNTCMAKSTKMGYRQFA